MYKNGRGFHVTTVGRGCYLLAVVFIGELEVIGFHIFIYKHV